MAVAKELAMDYLSAWKNLQLEEKEFRNKLPEILEKVSWFLSGDEKRKRTELLRRQTNIPTMSPGSVSYILRADSGDIEMRFSLEGGESEDERIGELSFEGFLMFCTRSNDLACVADNLVLILSAAGLEIEV